MAKNKLSTAATRRKFLGGAAVAGVATIAMPQVSRAQTVTLKMQGGWGATDILNDYGKDYAAKVNEMGGGRLKIDYLNAGAVVKAFSVMDATSSGVLDGNHSVPAYWYGKHRAASLFGTGPCYGTDASQFMGWFYYGGGQALYDELTQKILGLNVTGFYVFAWTICAISSAPVRPRPVSSTRPPDTSATSALLWKRPWSPWSLRAVSASKETSSTTTTA